MFPIRDDNPQVNKPIAIYGLIVANALAWFLLQGFGFGDQLHASVCQYGLIPADLFSDGLLNSTEKACPGSGAGWSGVFSSMFMHGSWMHILGNMWFLWVFGDNVEDSMGSVRFVIFYVLCGVCAAAAQVIADPGSAIPMVGASGAIGGVMGAYIMLFPRVKVHMAVVLIIIFTTFRVPAVAMLGYWIVVQLLGAFSSMGATGGGVAFWAHVGGFLGGAALVWVFKDDELLLNHPFHGWKETRSAADIWNDPSNRQ
ncbi:rhomboid family intramembrane serine protease [Teredinibacter haidensis]|uniref:rhomboid family intramembrane serine protease n=1 Tax=Teredinibacter haidensis TaxID=2731755 RepID=UPI0009491A06|nr:rhomboid family intramembrane serine protease [Teredinibacter haidensis]